MGKKFFLFLIIISILSCPTIKNDKENNNDNDDSGKKVISIWDGAYTGGVVSGNISTFILYDDNSFTGTWNTTNNIISINLNGTYTLIGTTFTFTSSGTAYNSNNNTSSEYTMNSTGTLNESDGNGTYSIDFVATINWEDDTGTYNITKR